MIKTLSPYYIEIPLTSPASNTVCGSYTIQLFIWQGNKTAVPNTSSYQITRVNQLATNGIEKVNIARIVSDFIDFQIDPQTITGLYNSNNQAWFKFQVVYDVDPELIQLEETNLAIKGYGYFTDGANPTTPINKVLITQDEFKVNRGGLFVMPIKINEI